MTTPALSSVAALKTCTLPVPGNKCLYHGPNCWIKFNFSGFLVGQEPYIGHLKFTWFKMFWDVSLLVNQTQHDNDVTEMHFGSSERELELRGNWNHRIMTCSVFGGSSRNISFLGHYNEPSGKKKKKVFMFSCLNSTEIMNFSFECTTYYK